ncbi:MAG TPA: ATP-binding protein [Myxococcota bacterium]|nr:ATP-binding protein [Myxococcota bacterium]
MLTSPWRLMAALAGLLVLGIVIAGIAADRGLRELERQRVEISLREQAEVVAAELCPIDPKPDARARQDAACDRLAEALHVRVSLIASDGSLLADSDVDADRIASIESHAQRPEVREALAGRVGEATRRSDTIGRDLHYVALLCPGGGVVRVAGDVAVEAAAQASLRARLFGAACLGLLVSICAAWLLSRYAFAPIREMRRVAASIASGHLEGRLATSAGDELSPIAGAINQLAEQLRLRLEEVTQEKEQLRAVLEGMVEGVLVVDAKGSVLLANSRLREFYELTGNPVGRPYVEVLRDAAVDEVLRETAERDVTRQLRVGRGVPRTLQVQAVRFPATGGPRAGSVAVFHDISELARLEEVRRDFVANASHELRTPLAAIRGFAETLLDSPSLSDAERRSYLEIIDRHAQRLTHIVHDLLELSTIERGRLRLDPVEVDVGEVIGSLIRDTGPRLRDRKLELQYSARGSGRAFADPRALEQILINLLDNAMKYTEPGGKIEITVEDAGPKLRVRMRDTGIGIPEEDLGRIFERFYRVDKARSRALGGTGLGLAIVKHLVQSLGGEISVASRLGEGSIFSFTLPRAAAAKPVSDGSS